MFKLLHTAFFATLIFLVLMLFTATPAPAQDVTYCKDYETGEIFIVEVGYPCPFPSVQL